MSFSLVSSVVGDGELLVRKYRSSETGITVVVANVEGPLVNGFLTFATEAHDDDGIPHTLEHLVFMGSRDYPYKGVLDLLANRCLASGTNAWTDTDHTCYTMTTAGADGFLNLLPIYLDHCLYPTLSDSAFTTEVHHINEEGEDAGVVYCEMQGRENTGESRCYLEMLRAMYPGHCGYKSETGGLMKNLRESTTNEKIKAYHAAVYRPENLCIIVTGQLKDDDVLRTVGLFEQKILNYRRQFTIAPWERPWQSPVPPLAESVDKIVEYPCDDEDNGLVYIAWRGPKCTTEYEKSIPISLLTDYLNDTAASPLQQKFVELDDPYCSSVSAGFIENAESCIYFSFESVSKAKLDQVKDRLFEVLREIAASPEKFDMKRMHDIIHRKKLQLLSSMESSPHHAIASSIIGDFLYGNNEHDLEVRLRQVPIIEDLDNQGADYWLGYLNNFFLNGNCVTIVGKPSPALMEKSSAEEKARIEKQREQLGENGLKEKSELLNAAKQNNEVAPPPDMLTQVPIPSTNNIFFHSITRLTNAQPSHEGVQILGFSNISKIPFRFEVDNLKTNFITLCAHLNTSASIETKLRLLIPLWSEMVTESAIQRGDTIVPYETVVQELASDTIGSGASVGISGQFVQVVNLSLKVEVSKYQKGINWLRELLYDTVFTEERVKVVVKRMTNDLAMVKRKGNKVSSDLMKSMNYDTHSNFWALGVFRQLNFLNEVSARLKNSPQSVIDDLNHLRSLMTSLENIRVHINLNAKKVIEATGLDDLATVWVESFLPAKLRLDASKATMTTPVVPCSNLVLKKPMLTGSISGVGSVESNFLQQTVESIKSFTDPDLAPLLVLMQYLTQLEGPMWRQIRGIGLSYHYSISLVVAEGLLYFILFKSTHVVAAYKEAQKIVERHISGEEPFLESLFQSAKSSLVFELIEQEKTIPKVSTESMLNYLRGVDMNYGKLLVDRVMKVTLDDIKRVAPIHLQPLFDIEKSRVAVCCHPSKVDEVISGFKELNRELSVVNLEDNTAFISKL